MLLVMAFTHQATGKVANSITGADTRYSSVSSHDDIFTPAAASRSETFILMHRKAALEESYTSAISQVRGPAPAATVIF